MKNLTFVNYAYGSIWHFRAQCSAEEFESLKKEVNEFCVTIKDRPVSEQKKLFDEKYGQFVNSHTMTTITSEVKSINSKLSFFLILTVITLIVVIFGAMLGSL